MLHVLPLVAILSLLFLASCAAGGAGQTNAPADAPHVFDIPPAKGDAAFQINILTDLAGKTKAPADLDAHARLAYDEKGLRFSLTVTDSDPFESDGDDYWSADSIELFIADGLGSKNFYQVVLSPGVDPKHPEVRAFYNDQRRDDLKKTKLAVTYHRTKLLYDSQPARKGYRMEVLFPWDTLGITPAAGTTLGFQFYINDRDCNGERFRLVWFPKDNTHGDSTSMHTLRLAARASPAIDAVAQAYYENFRRTRVDVTAAADLIGAPVSAKLGSATASKTFANDGGRAVAIFTWPLGSGQGGKVQVAAKGQPLASIALPDLVDARARAMLTAPFLYRPAVFGGPAFPAGDFEQPSLVEDLIGPYTIKTTYYDANYNIVTTAQKPGRYGAVAEITPENGPMFRRFRTVYCMPDSLPWWKMDLPVTFELPKQVGLDPAVVKEQGDSMKEPLKWALVDAFFDRGGGAAMLAGLSEMKPGSGPAGAYDNWEARDRAWWVGLKRKIYGNDKAFPNPLRSPYAKEGAPATVVHEGSLAEAGMKAGTREKLDALLKEWAANSDQAFNVCIVRNGVVVIDAAYGTRDDKPMTTTTKSYLASITKAISGTALMMTVDQGLISLDDTTDKFLPPFKAQKMKQPLIRQLYTHTAGFWDHRDDGETDFEETMALYGPHLKIADHHEYNGTSLALGSCIVEQISGESLPAFYRTHIFGPLGMTHTDCLNSSYNTQGTARDLAILGQMLCNHRAYGNQRFFKEETFAQMLPHRLVKELSPDTTTEWGIGLVYFGKNIIGHGSASSSTFKVDLDKKLVVTMTRNDAGKKFAEYSAKFDKLIEECLAETPVAAR